MAKGVLGNDPFLRGAAVRTEGEKAEAPAKATKARPAPAAKVAASLRKPAREATAPKGTAPAERRKGAAAKKDAPATERPKPARAEAPARTEAPARAPRPRAEKTRKAPPAVETREAPVASPPASETPVARVETPVAAVQTSAPVEPDLTAARQAPEPTEAPTPAVAAAAPAAVAEPQVRVEDAAPPPAPAPAPAAAAGPEVAAAREEAPASSRYEEALVLSVEEARALEAAAEERRYLRLVAASNPSLQGETVDASPTHQGGARGVMESASGAMALAREVVSSALQSPGLLQAVRVTQGVVNAVRSGLGTRGSREVDAYGRDASLVRELGPLTDFLYSRYWRVSVQGAVHVPSGPVLLVANHSGALPFDGPVLHQSLVRERPDLLASRWLVEDQVFHAPFFGTLLNRLGALRACPENAMRLLEEGRPVIVFPEGAQGLGKPFRERYQLKRFGRGGFIKLALRARVPVVPVAIVGAEETTPLLARLPLPAFGLSYLPLTPLGPIPLPARWSLRFGEPLDLEGLGPEAADTLGVVQRLTERTRDAIQGMLQALLRERKGVFTG